MNIRQITEKIKRYDGWYCHLLNTLFNDESDIAVYTAEKLEDILDSDEFVEARGNADQNQILINALTEETETRVEQNIRECSTEEGFDWDEYQYLCDIAEYWDTEE